MFKRLITCNDGTWNKPAIKDKQGKEINTNVCYLYNAIAPKDKNGVEQRKFYDTGVGSGYQLLDQIAGGLTGEGIDRKIKNAYQFLVLNYDPGDDIYLFGFSRGAYTARSLAGFIRCCGILKPENMHFIDEAYRLYRDRNDYTKPESDLMRSFRKNFSFEDVTRIKFIGVWDTVGALGIPLPAWRLYNLKKYKFHDPILSSTIDYAYHALAIDEHRKNFAPVLWELSNNQKGGGNIEVEQRWFAGAHSDVGGGYLEQGLSNRTLYWMIEKAANTNLAFDDVKLASHPENILEKIHDSYTCLFWLGGWILRNICTPESAITEVIDESVFERIRHKPDYRPKNIIPKFFDLLTNKGSNRCS